jgi:4-carboxymuconolactone decarboxylase
LAEDLYKTGEKMRRRVLGDAHVDRAQAATTPFDLPFQDYITRNVWGSLWGRTELTLRERSLVTVAILAALGRHEELLLHLRATRNTGASEADIRDVLLHVAVYAGVPAANSALAAAKRIFAETEAAPAPAKAPGKEPASARAQRKAKGKKP